MKAHGHLPYSLTIACSSTLLFLVQPMMAKAILPRFGGTAGVWVTCMLFFQVALLIGYLYSYLIARLNGKLQTLVHVALLLASLAALPLKPRLDAPVSGNPVLAVLGLLATSVGLPYFVLATTSPLLQSWYAGTGARFPYRLFALSNAASLVALLAYPVAIEPLLPQQRQLLWWSGAYAVFVLLAVFAAVRSHAHATPAEEIRTASAPLWVALAACASTLWLATANHLSQEVAPIPFLWVLPLSLYLLTFVLCFEAQGWYRPEIFRWLLPAAWAAVCFRIARQGQSGGLEWEIPVMSAALFICCMFCHGELAASKPEPRQGLPFFYLMVALGGALGAVFVGVIAPNIFNRYLELPIGITASVVLALPLVYGYTSRARLIRLGLVGAAAFVVATRFSSGGQDVARSRNFYGAIQVGDTGSGETAVRSLYNGRTRHGVQFLAPDRSRLATAYFGAESGAGRVFASQRQPERRVGIIGLGAGTLASYGRAGDRFRFYEINPAVVEVASRYFRFVAESEAQTDIVLGDGRLALEREPAQSFDVIVLDAFSDDSIPLHLLTTEAFRIYFDHLRAGGVLALHITNRYLDLYPVVAAAAEDLGKPVLLIHSAADPDRQVSMADWAVMSDNPITMRDLARFSQPDPQVKRVRQWTDDYSNLFGVLR